MNAVSSRITTTRRICIKATHSSLPLLTICAWCRRVRDPRTSQWITAAAPTPVGQATHGICPACHHQQLRALATAS